MRTTILFAGAGMAALIASAAFAAPATTATTPATPAAPATPASPATPAMPTMPATPATPATASAQVVARGDLIDTLKASGQFNTFIQALTTTNLVGVIKSHPNMTVFAPTDAAFAALPPGRLDALMKNPAELQKLLAYHLVNTTVDSSKIKGAKGPVMTVANSNVELDGSGASLMVNTATITQADVKTTGGGTIQVIDKVLDPSVGATPAPAQAAPAASTEPAGPATPTPAEPPKTTPKG